VVRPIVIIELPVVTISRNIMKLQPRNHGFTLIELLVTIVIVGLLVGILLPNMLDMRLRSRDAKRKSELRELKTALQIYYEDNQTYPANTADIGSSGGVFTSDGIVYMPALPEEFSYSLNADGEGFLIWATLENLSDQEAADSQSKCSVVGAAAHDYYECAL